MNLSLFARTLSGPFMIHPQQAAAMMPVVHGILTGMEMDTELIERRASHKVASKRDYNTGDKTSARDGSGNSVFVTYLDGTMTKYDTCYTYGTRTIAQELLKADEEPDIIGHIIVADSGGGSADSVPELADAIKQLKKPVVGFIDGMAASACIYALSYTAKIIAHQPTDQVGCVGTMITISGWPKLRRDADGYVQVRIYADQSAEKNADYEAALEGNAQIIKEELLNPLCQDFIDAMKTNRPAATDDQLKGRTYFARDVVGTLIDAIGSFESAIKAVVDLAVGRETAGSEPNEQVLDYMPKYTRLESIPELTEQVYEGDGSTVLQECQLEAIETALGAPRAEEADLQSRLESLTEAHQSEVDGLKGRITELEGTISQQTARISELEAALEASDARNREEMPAGVQLDADPANERADGSKPAATFNEAVDACRSYLKKQSK